MLGLGDGDADGRCHREPVSARREIDRQREAVDSVGRLRVTGSPHVDVDVRIRMMILADFDQLHRARHIPQDDSGGKCARH